MFPRSRSIIKFPDSARNRNPEEYKGTVFYRTFVLLAPFYNILRATGNFFSCDSTSANKNAKSGKNHQQMDVARLGFRKTNVGARKAGLVT